MTSAQHLQTSHPAHEPTVLQLSSTDGSISAEVAIDAAMNYALAHNGISPLRGIRIENRSQEPLRGLGLEISLEGPVQGRIAAPFKAELPEISGRGSFALDLDRLRWDFHTGTFAQLDEAVTASMTVRLITPTDVLTAHSTLRLLARDEWWWLAIEESLAAFVTPRARAIQDLVGEASDLLGERTGDPSVQGYQGGSDRALQIAAAIYDAMRARRIRYIDPPPSFEGTGQKIRPADEVLVDRWGTCLDLAATYAGALEHAGLNPVLVLCRGHAFSGHLLDEQQLPELVVRGQSMIRNLVESGVFQPLETVALCAGEPVSYAEASERTRHWWTESIDDVDCLIDVRSAHRTVRPLPAMHREGGVRVVEVERPGAPPAPRPVPPRADPAPTAHGRERPEHILPPRVARWCNSLLDLSFRNPLLNMRSGASSLDLHVPRGSLGTLEDMVFDGRPIVVLPHDEIADIHRARGARSAQDIEHEELAELLGAEGKIFSATAAGTYVSRMRGLQRRARTVLEETGANNLFLALGSLIWQDKGREARAPLFLIPVTMRAQRGRPFSIQIDDGAYAQPNQCLLEKLRLSAGLRIPEFQNPESDESGIDLAGSLQAIRGALIDAGLPFAIDETAHLAILQFSTLQLWQDLSENWQSFLRNPVVRHLVETPTDSFVDPVSATPAVADAEARAYCPVPFDGSQLEAVAWAEAGGSFVLEGPPGTGKSQTITNLIANALAVGKTVLFVAEKQAALDVVKRRLDKVGLGDLCLDLHGKDQTPDRMRKQLREALHLRSVGNPESWEALRARHQGGVTSLGRYPVALHEPGGAGLSAWTARQLLLTAADGPEVDVAGEVVSRPLDTDELYRGARELTQALFDLGSVIGEHPWRLARRSALDEGETREHLRRAVEALGDAVGALPAGSVVDLLDLRDSGEALDVVADWLRATARAGRPVVAEDIAAASQPTWPPTLAAARASLASLRADAVPPMAAFTPTVLEAVDLDELLISARTADGKLFKGKARRAVVEVLSPLIRTDATVEPTTITQTIEALVGLKSRAREVADEVDAVPGLVMGDGWNPLAEDADGMLDAQVAALEASARLLDRLPAAADIVLNGGFQGDPAAAIEPVERLARTWGALVSGLECTPASIAEWRGQDRALLGAIREGLPAWVPDSANGAFVRLGRLQRVLRQLDALAEAGLQNVAAKVAAGDLAPDDIEPALRRGIARAALAERQSAPVLAGFDGLARDRAIAQFSADGGELRREMVAELPSRIVTGRSFTTDRLVGKVGELSRELSRKRGGQKIRELFVNYGPIVGELTPCLMMSPHSVARFLPPDALEIDLVVFDEASQIRVAESIGAMGRARATVVVGDSQQMPPSGFGLASGESEEEDPKEWLGIPADMESVLSEAVESNLPRLWLSWHYRSQHESLIAFSNRNYYEGRLASFPRPPGPHPDLGVSWRRVNGTFERGAGRVNRVEAAAIVAEIRDRLARGAGASIGVVTFNTQQRDLILDMLEESDDHRIAAALAAEDEPIFVKNLENVQGDERDVILFSLAFSPNPETGQLPLNFGPLLQAGGERRLNVAVTRARAQVVLFSSFDPGHIDLSRSSSIGLAHLRSYLEMAGREAGDPGVLRTSGARDWHREEVVATLEEAGLLVRTDVGLSDFRVDLGVAEREEGPWIALFLDGLDYAARVTVADRESLPHAVLVGALGWAGVARVWLPDWLRDRDEIVGRIVRTVHEAVLAPVEPPLEKAAIVEEPTPEGLAGIESVAQVREPERAILRFPDPPTQWAPVAAAPPATAAPEHPVFTPASDDAAGHRETLDLIGLDGRADRAVRTEVLDVIAQEGPVEGTRLARIVCRRFDLQRLGAKRVASVLGLVPSGQLEQTPFGTFAWADGQEPSRYVAFRLALPEASRVVQEIAPQEILNAMAYLARVGSGVTRDELLRETALLFGIRRMAAKTRGHLDAVLDHGIGEHCLHDDGLMITFRSAPR